MINTEIDIDLLAMAIERALGDAGVALGSRLRTEQQIASRLNISRWRLRDALNLLVDRGLISRQRGSGTYFRHRPTATGPIQAEQSLPRIATLDLFPEQVASAARPVPQINPQELPVPAAASRALRIGLLCDLNSGSRTTRQIQAYLVRDINAAGHQLNIQSSTHREINLLTPQEILSQLTDEACDGYIAQSEIAENFIKALTIHAGDKPIPPVVFYGARWSFDIPAPFVGLHDNVILPHVFEQFMSQGITRVGMLRLRRNRNKLGFEAHDGVAEQYETMLRRHKLSYHAIEYTQSELTESVVDAMRAMTRLLTRPDRPQGIYVSDDHLMPGVVDALEHLGLVPGKDVAIITIGHRGKPLPGAFDWSFYEYSLHAVAQLTIDTLLRRIQNPEWVASSIRISPNWHPGQTHFVSR